MNLLIIFDQLASESEIKILFANHFTRAATRKHTKVGQKYFKWGKHTFGGGGKNSKYKNKINNNSENYRGKIAARGRTKTP